MHTNIRLCQSLRSLLDEAPGDSSVKIDMKNDNSLIVSIRNGTAPRALPEAVFEQC